MANAHSYLECIAPGLYIILCAMTVGASTDEAFRVNVKQTMKKKTVFVYRVPH
jgi:hypothetical protein